MSSVNLWDSSITCRWRWKNNTSSDRFPPNHSFRFFCMMCTHILTLSAICSFNTSMGTANSPSPFSELRNALGSGAWEKGLEKSINKLHTMYSSKLSSKIAGGVRNLLLILLLVKVDSVSHGVCDSYVISDCRGPFLGMASCCGNPLRWLLQWIQSTNI